MMRQNFLKTTLIMVLSLLLVSCADQSTVEPTSLPETEIPPPTETSPSTSQADLETSEVETQEEQSGDNEMDAQLTLTSPSFADGEPIPVIFSCDGDDISPALTWSGIPEGTESLALIMDDPDAPLGTWVHWVLFNLPPDSEGLEQDAAGQGVEGKNSWKRTGYGGPCPPGGTHRYFFKLYALDQTLELESGADKAALEDAIKGRILDQAELMGTFSR